MKNLKLRINPLLLRIHFGLREIKRECAVTDTLSFWGRTAAPRGRTVLYVASLTCEDLRSYVR